MHSPAAVALRPRLTAILRLDKPLALSRNTSRIFRMGSLSWGMPSPFERRASNCRFEPYPTGVPANTPQPGRHQSELVVAINWNHWSSSIGPGGRHQLESLVAFNRNRWSPSRGVLTSKSCFSTDAVIDVVNGIVGRHLLLLQEKG